LLEQLVELSLLTGSVRGPRSQAIQERISEPLPDDIAVRLTRLAAYFYSQGTYDEAETVFRHSMALADATCWPGHPLLLDALNFLAGWYADRKRYAEACPLYERAITVIERTQGLESPLLAPVLIRLADALKNLDRSAEADALEARLRHINNESYSVAAGHDA